MERNYKIFFRTLEDNYRTLDINDKFDTVINISRDENNFELFKGYEGNDDGLIKFKSDFLRWNGELMSNGILRINYIGYYNHMNASEMTFKRLCKGKYEHFETIGAIESKWIESTHNGGLTFCDAGTHQSYGFDFSSFYPFNMSCYKFQMPYKQGEEKYITEIPSKIQLGFYRVKITSEHKHATKVFAFSNTNTYTNTSLQHAIDLRDDYDIDFNIELIIDDKPNAYIYDSFVRGTKVFENWIDKLFEIKRMHPKNKLIKHLMSSLHGSLSRSNCVFKTFESIESEGLDVSMGSSSDYKIIEYVCNENKELYKLQCNHNPYRFPFRLKCFLTAFGRVKIAEVALYKIDDVIRVQTDGVSFKSDTHPNFPLLIADDKSTGMIQWDHVNKYKKLE